MPLADLITGQCTSLPSPHHLREFGCGVTSRLVRRCCRNRGGLLRKQKLDGNAAHCQHSHRPQGDVELYDPVAVCCCCDYWETGKRPRVTREGETHWFGWFSAFGWLREVLPSLSAKQLVKSVPAFCPLSACFLGWKKCTYDASRHASQKSGLPTRRLGW